MKHSSNPLNPSARVRSHFGSWLEILHSFPPQKEGEDPPARVGEEDQEKSTRQHTVRTVKKSRETRSRTSLARRVRQVWDGEGVPHAWAGISGGAEPALSG